MDKNARRKLLDEEHQDLLAQYRAASDKRPLDRLSESDLDTLILLETPDNAISEEVSRDFAERHGIEHDLVWNCSDVWIAVKSPAEAQELKAKYAEMGYTRMCTFMGSLKGEERHWVLKVEKPTYPWFQDSKGLSKQLHDLMDSLKLNPMYSYAFSGMAKAEFALTEENLGRVGGVLQELQKRGMDAFLSRDTTDSVDVMALWVAAPDDNAIKRVDPVEFMVGLQQLFPRDDLAPA